MNEMKSFFSKNEYNLNNSSNSNPYNHDSKKSQQYQQQPLQQGSSAKLNRIVSQSSTPVVGLQAHTSTSTQSNISKNNSQKTQTLVQSNSQQIKPNSNNNPELKHYSSIKTQDNNAIINGYNQQQIRTTHNLNDSRQSSAKSIISDQSHNSQLQKQQLKSNNNLFDSKHLSPTVVEHYYNQHPSKQQANDLKVAKVHDNNSNQVQAYPQAVKQQTSIKNQSSTTNHQHQNQLPQQSSSIIKTHDQQKTSINTNDLRQVTAKAHQSKQQQNILNDSKHHNQSVLPLNSDNKNAKILNLITNSNDEMPIFDPEPACDEEALPYSKTIHLDDKSFIVDDDELDNEVSLINSKSSDRMSNSSKDSVHIVNEVPEGRLSKKSSRSSQSSACSNSTRESSNILADFSDSISCNTDPNGDSVGDSEIDGFKNELLETLVQKFNVDVDDPSMKNRNLNKNSSDLQKKIHRTQLNKFEIGSESDASAKRKLNYSKSNSEFVKRNLKLREIKINCLPQTFQCKYLGKVRCEGLWGVRYTREPIDRLVSAAKCLQSTDELPSMEALISERGIYIVQKQSIKPKGFEKIYRSGLVPIGNISYGVQDNKYGKVFSCIVVRERDGKTLCECYAFLNTKAEYARRMALSLTLAFKEYGKLLQIKESKIRQSIKLEDGNSRDGMARDSVA